MMFAFALRPRLFSMKVKLRIQAMTYHAQIGRSNPSDSVEEQWLL